MYGYLDLIKTFWNLAWFGGSQNLFKQVDTVIASNLFSEKLQLSEKELTLAKNSFLDFNLETLSDQVHLKCFLTTVIIFIYANPVNQ